MMHTLSRLLVVSAAVVALVLCAVGYVLFSQFGSRVLHQAAVEESRTLARLTFASMYQVMRQGWTREQLLAYSRDLTAATAGGGAAAVRVDIHRGEVVSRQFGQLPGRPVDALARVALAGGEHREMDENAEVRQIFPLRAQAECLSCHTTARQGDLLGVIDVRVGYGGVLDNSRRELLSLLLFFVPVPLLAALGVAYWLNRRINNSLTLLDRGIERVNSVSDLTHLEFHRSDVGLEELNAILGKVGRLAERLRQVAVDKDLLEFEIRLLEKFIITSEVVKDWREYVNHLLREINRVIDAYTLFCIFKVDEELFDLEVFWRQAPDAATREMMERRVRAALETSPHLAGATTLNIVHNVADSAGHLPLLDPAEIDLQTKSLLVETPQIGGIVGIGVNSELARDETRRLVLDSILSTLLNVVGSIKAIYKYTRDLEYYATRDPLTNLYNQRAFWELAGYEVVRSNRHDYSFALMVVDLDNFKTVNDTYGHGMGDRYLQACADVVHQALRGGDILARYGGDEFVVLLPEVDLEAASAIAQRVVNAVDGISLTAGDGGRAKATASVGIAIYPNHARELKDLFLFADNMMYKAKESGKNRIGLPTEADVVEVFRRIGEKSQIVLDAVERRRLVPYFQPILRVEGGGVAAVEVLSRIRLPDDQVMGAGEFIEIAEKMGVIHRIDYLVLDDALRQAAECGYEGLLFINLSPRALVLSEFIPEVRRIVQARGGCPERIVFEITERDTVKNISVLEAFITELRREGFRLAIDDFGSGFSSFHYLKRFPIDIVKIEGEFIVNMVHDAKDRAFVRSVTQLSKELGIRTVAEFVENQEVLDQVTAAGIDLAQGYHIGRPIPSLREAARLGGPTSS